MKHPLKGSTPVLWQIHVAATTCAAGIAAASYFLFVGPSLGRDEQMSLKQAQFADRQAELTSLSVANKDTQIALAAAKSSVQAGSVTLQSRHQLNQRLADLTQLATEKSLEIAQLTAGKSSDGPRYGTVAIHCSAKGNYRACDAFLSACAAKYPDIAVIGLTASSNPEIPEVPIILTIDLLWFIASDKPAPGK